MVVTHVFDVEPFRPEMCWDLYTCKNCGKRFVWQDYSGDSRAYRHCGELLSCHSVSVHLD